MGDVAGNPVTTNLLIIVLLVLVNAFFSISEMAFVSADRTKLKHRAENGSKSARKVLRLTSEPTRFVTSMQVCSTLISFFNIAYAALSLTYILGVVLRRHGIPFPDFFALCLLVLTVTYLTVIFGQMVPKRIALQNPDRISMLFVGPVSLITTLVYPLAKLFAASTHLTLRLFGINVLKLENKVTLEEIRSVVDRGQEQGIINPVEHEMIDSVINFDEKDAEDVMTARTNLFMIDIDDPPASYINELLSQKFSRIPVYEENPDNIIGVLYLKDYMQLAYRKGGFDRIQTIRGILRPAYFVPERKNINDLFIEMQDAHRHMAILIDEYGGVSGVVTMEDLIEEIMGDIDDEYDHDEPDVIELSDNTYRANGSTSIKEFNSETGAELDENSDDYDTIGGFLIELLDYIPEDGERPEATYENLHFKILKVEDKRICEVRVKVEPIDSAENDEDE